MIDMVPKAITFTLVNHSKENLQRELLQELYKPDVLDDLLRESEHVVARRREVIATLAALNKADEYVNQINCGGSTNLFAGSSQLFKPLCHFMFRNVG